MKQLTYILLLFCVICNGQDLVRELPSSDTFKKELNINEHVEGTLWMPALLTPSPLVIMLTGSGPNNRDGNSMMTKNDSHKQLAQLLLENNISTYRYDKRVVTQMRNKKVDDNISFDDFITDAKSVVEYFKDDQRFSKIFIAGHSQGSLVGMLAINKDIDGFISLAGAGDPIDKVIVSQLAVQSPGLDKYAAATFKKMRESDALVEDVYPTLVSLQGKHIQPFMKSWMKYDPAIEIAKLEIPVLVINGDRDFQVDTSQAKILHEAANNSKLVIIKGMNHVLKQVGDDDIAASKSYTDPSFPIHPELLQAMLTFIHE